MVVYNNKLYIIICILYLFISISKCNSNNDIKRIKRVRWLGKDDEFVSYYINKAVPIIIENSPSKSWLANKNGGWTPDYLRRKAHIRTKLPCKNSTNPRFGWGCCKIYSYNVNELFENINKRKDLYYYYAGPTKILGPLLMKELDISILDANEADNKTFPNMEADLQSILWIGGSGVTTPLHYDGMHNFFTQMYGQKKFKIFPPESWRYLYLFPKFHLQHRNSQINLNKCHEDNNNNIDANGVANIKENRYPHCKQAKPLEVTLSAGDVLYLPPMWFHEVESIGTSIGVNVWSPSKAIETIRTAWSMPLPFKPNAWTPQQLVASAKMYIWLLYEQVFKNDKKHGGPRKMFKELLDSRYEPLYGKNGNGPYSFKNSSDLNESDHEDDHVMRIELDSPEGKQYFDYVERVKKEPPLINDMDGPIKSKVLGVRDQKEDYLRYKDVYNGVCTTKDVMDYVKLAAPKVKEELKAAAITTATAFNAVKPTLGIKEIMFLDFIEDLISNIIGDDQAYAFVKYCLLNTN